MLVYRITGKKYADDLTGTGAAMFGGRWNKKGTPVLYTGESKDIALLDSMGKLSVQEDFACGYDLPF